MIFYIQVHKDLRQRKQNERTASCFLATYDFHIHENTPKYIFDSKDNYTLLIYLNENNDISFLTIDGNTQQEVNGIILYDSVHYSLFQTAATRRFPSVVSSCFCVTFAILGLQKLVKHMK